MIDKLIYIKHRLLFIWKFIEWLNGILFGFFYTKRLDIKAQKMLDTIINDKYEYRKINRNDLLELEFFLNSQQESQYKYFKPHQLDRKTLISLFENPSFLMMGVYERKSGRQVGYFFLRMFLNKQGFIGRMVDENHRRQGIATTMNEIMYQTLWQNGFRCLSTISKHNKSILKLHEKDGRLDIIKELPNDYLLVEIKNR